MKKLLIVAILFCFTAPSISETIRLSSPIASDDVSETFGEHLDTSRNKVSLTTLMQSAPTNLGKPFLLEVNIAKVCQKKGCFFIAKEGDFNVRVAFKDYGFFIPTDASNKTVQLTGTLVEKTLSQEKAAHFNSDINDKRAAIKPGKTYEIIANSIRVPK